MSQKGHNKRVPGRPGTLFVSEYLYNRLFTLSAAKDAVAALLFLFLFL
jgi:hypothetical protein